MSKSLYQRIKKYARQLTNYPGTHQWISHNGTVCITWTCWPNFRAMDVSVTACGFGARGRMGFGKKAALPRSFDVFKEVPQGTVVRHVRKVQRRGYGYMSFESREYIVLRNEGARLKLTDGAYLTDKERALPVNVVAHWLLYGVLQG